MGQTLQSHAPSHGISVRQAEAADAGALAVLYDELLRSYGHQPRPHDTPGFIADLLQRAWVRMFIAADAGGALVGFIGCGLTYSAVSLRLALTINDLFVLPHVRRRGVATQLLAAAQTYATRNGMAKIFVEAATEATFVIRLYERAGFVVLPHTTLKKELDHGV